MMMRIRRCGIIYTQAEGIALTVETRLLLSFPVPPTEVGLLFFVLEKGAERPLVSFLFPPLALNRIGDGGPPPIFVCPPSPKLFLPPLAMKWETHIAPLLVAPLLPEWRG